MTLDHVNVETTERQQDRTIVVTFRPQTVDCPAADPLPLFETVYGKRIKGTLKTNRRTGFRVCQFSRGTIVARVDWFETGKDN